jgi:HAD superfamily hydrolase (TIGR01549 family)
MERSEHMPGSRFKAILFDLGGVLVELRGLEAVQAWTKWDRDELWRRWLASPTVRHFESGRISIEQFGQDLVDEFSLPVDAAQFLANFAQWPKGQFPGVEELLDSLAPDYKLGCLSNTNAFHWDLMVQGMGFFQRFDYAFPSHQTGYLKPDEEAFKHAAAEMLLSPNKVLFLDDNQVNVEGARKMGMEAYRVHGARGAQDTLQQLGIL